MSHSTEVGIDALTLDFVSTVVVVVAAVTAASEQKHESMDQLNP